MPALFKSRKIGQGTATKRKAVDQVPKHDASESDSGSDSDGPVKQASSREKKQRTAKVDTGEVHYDHSHKDSVTVGDDATKQSILYSDVEKPQSKETHEEPTLDGVYRGKSTIAKFIETKESGKAKFGPLKAATNIRSTTMVDYQPDVCKDYKLTGFCGYGDNCKFLHSREDYAAGWKLDKEWDEAKSLLGKKTATPDEAKSTKVDIPFKCVICKSDYKEPVVTPCTHYFCESCFFEEYQKQPGCFICGKNTGGVAKPAKNIKKLLSLQQPAEEQKA